MTTTRHQSGTGKILGGTSSSALQLIVASGRRGSVVPRPGPHHLL
jgi:hypothetical protein